MTNQNQIAARLDAVSKTYGNTSALQGVDLQLERGRITALLGPNGAGKTTAVRLLLGLTRPSAGRVSVFGLDPRNAAARQHTGAMLQVSKVPETLRVREHIEVFRSYYRAPLPLAELIATAGLEGIENRMFGTLSGGQRQRVLFALALCGDPELIVLDEPTVGLDVASRRALWASIRQLADHGRAVLLTTHYLEEAEALAQHVVILTRGRVAAEGSPAQIRARETRRRVRFRSGLPRERIGALVPGESIHQQGDVIELLTSDVEEVLRVLLMADPGFRDLEVAAAGLETAFLALTRDEASTATPVLAEVGV